ncbi:MAG TPA: phosphoribosylformylglycinamidine synthase I [Ilumatobacter sp.]|jgi:phosphoribosylformylglycinamidine synthase|nr:phosphoribosylformylglycinamidine synthase I [Ilumatobacter sp.]
MRRLPALIIAGPGTNRDCDLALALELAGADPVIVLARELAADPKPLAHARLVGIAGGFSYGDALGAGRMLALDLMVGFGDALEEYVATGRPLIGICNGFQVLTRARLLPGALGHNAHGRFECRWVELAAERASVCLWTRGIDDPIHCPIAHGEGRYVHPDPAALDGSGQIALRYRSPNPNGSIDAVAGVCNAAGNVLGLMPHPENHVITRQHPHPRAGGERHLGLRLFRNGVNAAKEM